MDAGYVDALVGGSFLLFTGAEVVASDTVIELLSKFGVVAVLWYWLKDMKDRVSELLKTFDTENKEMRDHYDKIITGLKEEHRDYKDRVDKQLEHRVIEIHELNKTIQDLTVNKKS